jgi:iron complex outermembrane receptor protein
MFRFSLFQGASLTVLAAVLASTPLAAQQAEQLPDVNVTSTQAKPGSESEAIITPPVVERFQLPQTSASVTKEKFETQVNVVDTEDALKYLPSLFVRKRNNGDTQPVLATRTWGVNSSARSLVYADDLLLTALVANNNTIGSPRWGLVSPEEISRIDVLYGPFAAAYPGNSMGAVTLITTQMPDKPTATIKQTQAFQTFDMYGFKRTLPTSQTSAFIGNKIEYFSWVVSANFADSYSQPLTWVTATSSQTTSLTSAGITGSYSAANKSGTTANVVGAAGLLHTQMANTKLKLKYDFNPSISATYMLGLWTNNGGSSTQSFLKDSSGVSTFGGAATSGALSSFASGTYDLRAAHVSNSFNVKSDTKGEWDWEVSGSRYDIATDYQAAPYGVSSTSDSFSSNGKLTSYNGTNWMNFDAKGIWRPNKAHEVSFGVHSDRYQLRNPAWQLASWQSMGSTTGSLYSMGRGQTTTNGAFVQDAWRFLPKFKLTTGVRIEGWRASDGYNYTATANSNTGVISSATSVNQPGLTATHVSPKASLSYDIDQLWTAIGSYGNAARFATVGELYQSVTSGSSLVNPNPNLRPEIINTGELAFERKIDDGKIRLSFFEERVKDALISQSSYNTTSGTTTAFVDNVDRIRNRGVELAAQKDDVLFEGMQLSGSVTYVNSRIVSDPNFRQTVAGNPTSVVGKKVPYVPDWRGTLAATYKPDTHWALTVAGRYQGNMFSTLDNTDVNSNVYGAFDRFVVADVRAQYAFNDRVTLNAGIDNIFDRRYTLFHPFPGRTYAFDLKVKF